MFAKAGVMVSDEDERLLSDSEDSLVWSSQHHQTNDNHSYHCGCYPSIWQLASLVLNFILASNCLVLFLIFRHGNEPHQAPFQQQIYSPAQSAISYETVIFHSNADNDTTPYQGPPSPAVDAAWEDLYRHVGISQIPYSSAIKLPNATALTRKGSDQYIVGLDVFHQLHCLNMIRKSLYPAYYNGHPQHVETTQNITLEETEDGMAWHLSHCIGSIRQSLMCSSDISTIYWHWLPELDKRAPSAQTTHTCRDFSRIKKWAEEHVLVGEFDDRNPF